MVALKNIKLKKIALKKCAADEAYYHLHHLIHHTIHNKFLVKNNRRPLLDKSTF